MIMLNTLQRLTKLTSWHHADVSPSIPHRTPTQNHVWLEADRQWSRTSSLWRRGSNCRLCPPGRWQKSHFAESGARFLDRLKSWMLNIRINPVHHLFVYIFECFANSPPLLSTASPVRQALGHALHGPAPWKRAALVQIFGKVSLN